MRRIVMLPVVLFLAAGLVRATPILLSFSVGFPGGAPTNPVTGSILYEAASVTGDITSLTSINLTIAGHAYVLGEVGFTAGPIQVIGGTLNFVSTVVGGTTDFALAWNQTTLTPLVGGFAYSAPGFGTLLGNSFPQFSVTEVPEPSTLCLCCFGVLVIAGVRRLVPRE